MHFFFSSIGIHTHKHYQLFTQLYAQLESAIYLIRESLSELKNKAIKVSYLENNIQSRPITQRVTQTVKHY